MDASFMMTMGILGGLIVCLGAAMPFTKFSRGGGAPGSLRAQW
jgi:hypothetical protein